MDGSATDFSGENFTLDPTTGDVNMDESGTDFSGENSTLNSKTGYSTEVFPGSQIVQLVLLTIPTISLSIFTIVAIALAKKINWKIKTLLINIFMTEVYFSLGQAIRYLGFPIRLLISDNPEFVVNFLCRITIHMVIVGGLVKVLSIAIYAVANYVFIKTNIKKVKWYAIIIPLIASWAFSILFGLPSLIFASVSIPRVFAYRGFCSLDLENKNPNSTGFFVALVIAWILYTAIAGTILFFVIRTIKIRKTTSSKVKKALARNLIYLTGGALFTITNAVAVPTIMRIVTFDLYSNSLQTSITYAVVSEFIINLLRSLSSLYIPVVTISLVKAARRAVKLC